MTPKEENAPQAPLDTPKAMPVAKALSWAIETLELAAMSEYSSPEDENAAAALRALADALPDAGMLGRMAHDQRNRGILGSREEWAEALSRLARVLGEAPRS